MSAADAEPRAATLPGFAIACGLVLLTWVAYWPSLGGEFLMSDREALVDNPRLETLEGLVAIWSPMRDRVVPPLDQYQPLSYTSFWTSVCCDSPRPHPGSGRTGTT